MNDNKVQKLSDEALGQVNGGTNGVDRTELIDPNAKPPQQLWEEALKENEARLSAGIPKTPKTQPQPAPAGELQLLG